MKAILVGLGDFGFGWFERLQKDHGDLQLVVVDSDESKQAKLKGITIPFYTSVTEAIEQEKPDILINVTPRHIHNAINWVAFEHKLPVFSEKPIANNYEDAIEIVEMAARENIPFMIAENYRTFPIARKLKQLLDQGEIGRILSLDGDFNRLMDSRFEDNTSLLEELIVHHFDLVRYWTGAEVDNIFTIKRHRLHIVMELQVEIMATFTCSSQSKGKQTEWLGNWRIEGTEGYIELSDQQICLTNERGITCFTDFSEVAAPTPFSEFLQSLAENREAETSGRQYLKNQALAHYARQSIQTNQLVDTTSSWGYGPMIVRNIYEGEFGEPSVAHDGKGFIRGKGIYGAEDFETPLQFISYCEVPPGASFGYHGHREDEELYIILEGTGVMKVNGEERQVKRGDILLNKFWWKHGLENNGVDPLQVLVIKVDKAPNSGKAGE